jgi:hypothetical protein
MLGVYDSNNAKVNGLFYHEWLGAQKDGSVFALDNTEMDYDGGKSLIRSRDSLAHWLQFMSGMQKPDEIYWDSIGKPTPQTA